MSIRRWILCAAALLLLAPTARAEIVTDYEDRYLDEETGLYFFAADDGRWGLMTEDFIQILEPTLNAPQGWDFYEFHEGVAAVCGPEGLWGYIDASGATVIPFQFECAGEFSEGLAAVRVEGLYGYIDAAGNQICEAAYERAFAFANGYARVARDGLYGYVDTSGTLVVEPQFDWAENFSEGLAVVEYDERYGCIDETGKCVIEPVYDFMCDFSWGLAVVQLDGFYGYVNATGAVDIPIEYVNAYSFQYGLGVVESSGAQHVIDATGAILLTIFSNGEFPPDIEILSENELCVDYWESSRVDTYDRTADGFRLRTPRPD